jgi:hypothetical protein
MVVSVGGGALCSVEDGFGDEGYLNGTRGEAFLDCCGEVNCEWEAE